MDLQEISDRFEIADVLTRYTRAVDTHEWDLLDTVFTSDAEIDYTESGGVQATYPEAKKWLSEVLPAFFKGTLHTVGQIEVIYLDDAHDSARVTAYFDNPMVMDDGAGGTKVVGLGGKYRHEMVRTADGWRSRKLFEEVVWKDGL